MRKAVLFSMNIKGLIHPDGPILDHSILGRQLQAESFHQHLVAALAMFGSSLP